MLVKLEAKESLCNSCLRPQPLHPTNEGKCEICQNDTCSCQDCQATLILLRKGIRDYQLLGLTKPIKSWSEETGVIL